MHAFLALERWNLGSFGIVSFLLDLQQHKSKRESVRNNNAAMLFKTFKSTTNTCTHRYLQWITCKTHRNEVYILSTLEISTYNCTSTSTYIHIYVYIHTWTYNIHKKSVCLRLYTFIYMYIIYIQKRINSTSIFIHTRIHT